MGAAQVELEALAQRLGLRPRRNGMIQSTGARTADSTAVLAPVKASSDSLGTTAELVALPLALPILAYEAVFILYPIGQGMASSFTRTDVGRPVTFVGLATTRMLSDPGF